MHASDVFSDAEFNYMQIIILGMHRSGTSAVTRLINMLGAYVGEENVLMPPAEDNEKGYWERHDVWPINHAVMQHSGGCWFCPPDVDPAAFDGDAFTQLKRQAKAVLSQLDTRRPWALKDPRMCMTFSFWRPLLEVPICVLVIRRPIAVARSLQKRNQIPLPVGLAIWEKHVLQSLKDSAGLPRFIVDYDEVMRDPFGELQKIHDQLVALHVRGLKMPEPREVTDFIAPELCHNRAAAAVEEQTLNQAQHDLYKAMQTGRALTLDPVPEMSQGGREILGLFAAGFERDKLLTRALEDIRARMPQSMPSTSFEPPKNLILPLPPDLLADRLKLYMERFGLARAEIDEFLVGLESQLADARQSREAAAQNALAREQELKLAKEQLAECQRQIDAINASMRALTEERQSIQAQANELVMAQEAAQEELIVEVRQDIERALAQSRE